MTNKSASSIATAAQAALTGMSHNRAGQTADKAAAGISPRSKVQKLSIWLAESNVDVEGIIDCTQEIVSFYEVQEQYNEKLVREHINRFVKARGLDK